jgi:putative DNA primase/helicase
MKVAEAYLARVGEWKIPELRGIINTPFLREDGSLCDKPGYDPASKLLFNPDGQSFPAIPSAPSKDDATKALKYINATLFKEFPFVGDVDRAVTLSGLLTAFDQRITAAAPLHGFTAPSAGTGKSLTVDLISIVTTGNRAPVIALGKSDEELEKRIETALITGDAIISLDNINRDLTSDVLSQALTQRQLKIRLLGFSRHVIVPATATFFVNGNNLIIGGDLPRRTLLSRLDAKIERPELRQFKRDVEETAFAERGKLVAAVLTILVAWQTAKPSTKIRAKPLGLFKRWSQRVRAPLLWLGCADPCDSVKDIRDKDPALSELETILLQWKEVLGTAKAYTVREVILAALPPKLVNFFDALAAVALSRHGPTISSDRLGRWLSRNEGKVSAKLKLERGGKSAGGNPLWRVRQV